MTGYSTTCIQLVLVCLLHPTCGSVSLDTTSTTVLPSTSGIVAAPSLTPTQAYISSSSPSMSANFTGAETSISPTSSMSTSSVNATSAGAENETSISPTSSMLTSPVSTSSIVVVTVSPTPSSPQPTQVWNKVVGEWLGDRNSFVIMVAAVGLCLILLIALIITCCRYQKLKKKTKFPKDLIINNDSAWINSNDDLLMWERNLRATEINPSTAPTTRPANEKRA